MASCKLSLPKLAAAGKTDRISPSASPSKGKSICSKHSVSCDEFIFPLILPSEFTVVAPWTTQQWENMKMLPPTVELSVRAVCLEWTDARCALMCCNETSNTTAAILSGHWALLPSSKWKYVLIANGGRKEQSYHTNVGVIGVELNMIFNVKSNVRFLPVYNKG